MKTAPRFESFPPYQPIEPFEVLTARLGRPAEEIVKLDANENPYGPAPKARQALAELAYAHIYPDPESRALRASLAAFTGVPAEYLMAGSGADELIDLLLRVLLEPGEGVLTCPPTFPMYAFDTLLNQGQVVSVPRRPDFSLDLEGIQAAVARYNPKVLFLATPNNPDGGLLPPAVIEKLLELPLLLVLDEAYIEFSGEGGRLGERQSWIKAVPERQNLVVLRTFSKWAGLAGLRAGYGAFPAWLMPVLWKAKQPYNVNVAASMAAIASIADLDWLAGNVDRLRRERARLFDRLAQIPYLTPHPSQANFILCQVKGRSAVELKQSLLAQGILVRYYNMPPIQDYLRISVGRPHDSQRICQALLALAGDPELEKQLLAAWAQSDSREPADNAGSTRPAGMVGTAHTARRTASIHRQTGETRLDVALDLDGAGLHSIHTGLGFFDHMLTQLSVHGLFDLEIEGQGDLQVDPHHLVEDTALALGEAFSQALGDRRGITRMGSAIVPMDESLAEVVLDFSSRPYAVIQVDWHAPSVGGIPNSLWAHFLESFAQRAGCTLHVTLRGGRDDHHQVEAIFKALGRALEAAVRQDPRRSGVVPSSKGTLSV
jgi:histidinol-phosphate aminotransferase